MEKGSKGKSTKKADALGEVRSNQIAKIDHSHMMVRNVPDEIKRPFKACCNLQGKDMREVLVKYMERYVKANLSKTVNGEED